MAVPVKTVADFRVSPLNGFPGREGKIVALANGQFDMAWTEDRTAVDFWDTDVRILRFNADGTQTSGTYVYGPHDTAESQAAVTTLGTLQVVAYTDRGSPGTPGSIRLDLYDSAALKPGGTTVRSVAVDTGGDAINPQVAALTNGTVAVVYFDDVANVVKARIYDPVLDKFTAASITVSSYVGSYTPAAAELAIASLSNGNVAMVWQTVNGPAVLRLLYPTGEFLSSPTQVGANVTATAMTELAGGRLAVATAGQGAVQVTLFDVAGMRVSLAGTATVAAAATDLAIAALDDGRAMIVWTQGAELKGSIVRADGSLDTPAFLIAADTGLLTDPDIETLADGRIVVSYGKMAGGVFATVLDPREAAVDLAGTGGDDQFTGTRFDDRFAMGDGNDSVTAGAGNDTIDGGRGADTMTGGAGNDTYHVDNARDVVIERAGEGTDTVLSTISYTLAANVENLVLSGAALNGTGNALANSLTGTAGNNVLDGKAGADVMIGLGGNDTYHVDNAGDVVVEKAGEGTDTILSSVSYMLSANVENLTLTGTAAIDGTGNELDNIITGNAAANRLSGGLGNDRLIGGNGNDVYFAVETGDTIVEGANGGYDTAIALSNYTLNAGAQVEKIANVYTGNRVAIDLTGNEFGQTIEGSAGANRLDGKGGADVLSGFNGNDTFVFSTALGSTNIDRITDFSNTNGNDDRIQLDRTIFTALAPGALSLDAFTANADGVAKDASDRIVYETDTGKLFYDANGNAPGGLIQFAVLDSNPFLTAADFFVI